MKRQAGFTLDEVLISFAILAIVMVSLYEASGTGLRSFEAAANVERALLVAQSRIDWIVAQRRLPEEATGAVSGSPFSWQIEVLPSLPAFAELRPRSARLRLVRISVFWAGNHGRRSVSVDRLVSLSPEGQQ